MGPWTRCLVTAIAAIACALAAGEAEAAKKRKPPKPAAPNTDMTFTIMRASDAACEPECPQWIAASGDIKPGTPGRLRAALKAAGKARLPIVINSPGGSVEAALAMGAMIRERKLTVAVGRSVIRGIAANEEARKPKAKPGTVYDGVISSGTAYCNSACTLVFASGSQRIASDWDTIGVHQIVTTPRFERVYYRETYRIIKGKKKVLSRKITGRKVITGKTTTKIDKGFRNKLAAYVKRMGVGQAYLDLFETAPPAQIHNMTIAERRATNIVTMPASAQGLARPNMCTGSVHAQHCVKRKPQAG